MTERRRCRFKNARGGPCLAWPLRDDHPRVALVGAPTCLRHTYSDEEWHALAIKGGEGRTRQREFERKMGELEDDRAKRQVLEALLGLLGAELPTIPPEPDYDARALGVLGVALLWQVGSRAELHRIMREIRQEAGRPEPDAYERRLLDLERARERLLAAVESGRIDTAEVPAEVVTALRKPLQLV